MCKWAFSDAKLARRTMFVFVAQFHYKSKKCSRILLILSANHSNKIKACEQLRTVQVLSFL